MPCQVSEVQFRKAFVDAGRAALPFFLGRVKIVVLSSSSVSQASRRFHEHCHVGRLRS